MAEDIRNMAVPEAAAFHQAYEAAHCVLLDSAYCSMGRMIAVEACELVGRTYHDGRSLLELAGELGVGWDEVEAFDARLAADDADLDGLRESSEFVRIAEAYDVATRRALATGPCLIHDRGNRALVERLGYSCVAAMTHGTDTGPKRERCATSPLYAHLTTAEELDAAIAREDRVRARWHELRDPAAPAWGDPASYALMLDTGVLGKHFSALMLARLMS